MSEIAEITLKNKAVYGKMIMDNYTLLQEK